MIKGGAYGNKAKGTNASNPINVYARSLLKGWLVQPVEINKEVDGKEITIVMPKLYTLKSRALIQELIAYNSEGNFDRISAMGMLMLLREDRLIAYGGEIESKELESNDYLGNDPFFKTNYDNRTDLVK